MLIDDESANHLLMHLADSFDQVMLYSNWAWGLGLELAMIRKTGWTSERKRETDTNQQKFSQCTKYMWPKQKEHLRLWPSRMSDTVRNLPNNNDNKASWVRTWHNMLLVIIWAGNCTNWKRSFGIPGLWFLIILTKVVDFLILLQVSVEDKKKKNFNVNVCSIFFTTSVT